MAEEGGARFLQRFQHMTAANIEPGIGTSKPDRGCLQNQEYDGLQTAYRVVKLWRYPVASIGGETVPSILVGTQGPVGDRMFGLFDAASGAPAAPEKDRRWHKALLLTASVQGHDIPTIRFPHGTELALDDGRAASCLSEFLGFGVGIGRIGPGEDRRGFPSIEHRQHHFPIHVLTIESLRHLARLRERETVDVRRFRPNILSALAIRR
jgi:uncharacterized protein